MKIKFSEKQICESIEKITKKQKVVNGYIRPVVWRGSEIMAISASKASVHIAIAAWTWHTSYFSPKKILNGISMTVSDWVRPSPKSAPVQKQSCRIVYDLFAK